MARRAAPVAAAGAVDCRRGAGRGGGGAWAAQSRPPRSGSIVLAALYLGFEGRALEAAALTRRGRPLADIVCAADSSAAERAFFARAVDSTDAAPPAPPRGGPAAGAPHAVIGLFPEAGG